MNSSTSRHLLFLVIAACFVAWLHQTAPALGDDLNYWGLAFDLHHANPRAWNPNSFHDLRWPVWFPIWLLQIPFGFSALSYYLAPMLYFAASTVLVYLLAREVGGAPLTALTAGIIFLFHPQLNPLIDRPMPDLSESFWVGVAFLAWLRMVRSDDRRLKVLAAFVIGLALATAQANRLTGVFGIPVLIAATLLCYPRQILWLALSGVFAAGFVLVEAAIYAAITGDWLHNINANLGARGRKGTEPIPLWEYPFRFLPALFGPTHRIVFNAAAAIGAVVVAWRFGRPGRALAIYAVGYLLTYSCALQSIDPPRPLVREGERFLGTMALPFSLLAAFGLTGVISLLPSAVRRFAPVAFLFRRPAAALALLVLGMAALNPRPVRGENFLHDLAASLRALPAGSRVLSHDAMLHIAHLAAPDLAAGLRWTIRRDLLAPGPDTRALVEETDYVWFNRKWIWTGTRKKGESDVLETPGTLAAYLTAPLTGWRVLGTATKEDVPDFVLLARDAGAPPLSEQSPDGQLLRDALFPELAVPAAWAFAKADRRTYEFPSRPVPPWLRGRELFLALRFSSNTTEPLRVWITLTGAGRVLRKYTLKPYFFPQPGDDFFFLDVPAAADTMALRVGVSGKAERVTLDGFRLFLAPTP